MERSDLTFVSGGTRLAGWHYQPSGTGPHPLVVMTHGFSGVREWLESTAEEFTRAGLSCLVYDHPGWGASEGEPRHEVDPWRQIHGYRDAITFARSLPGVDPERIGVWGTSYSGAHVLVVAAVDRRVRAVVSQVPLVDGWETLARLVPSSARNGLRARLEADRVNRYTTGSGALIPVASADPGAECALPGRENYEWLAAHAGSAPLWRNEVTVASLDLLAEYTPQAFLRRIAPTPVLMTIADDDTLCPTELALGAWEALREPKQLQILNGDHYVAYRSGFSEAVTRQAQFLLDHLATPARSGSEAAVAS